MKGPPGGSWRDIGKDIGKVAGGREIRSSAWTTLLAPPPSPSKSPSGFFRASSISALSPSSSSSSSSSFDMFLDSHSAKSSSCNGSFSSSFSQRKVIDGGIGGGGGGGGSECYRRAALDFVMELAGPRTISVDGDKVLCPDSFVCAEELPVSMFAVDKELQCTMWNRRLSELSGWSEAEVLASHKFVSSVFFPVKCNCLQKSCEEILEAAFFGVDVSGAEYYMRTKSDISIRVSLYANMRTDAVGAVSGVLCVVMKLSDVCSSPPPPPPRSSSPLPSVSLPGPQIEVSEDVSDRCSGSSSDDISVAGTTEPCTPSPSPFQSRPSFPSRSPFPSSSLEEGHNLGGDLFVPMYSVDSKDAAFQRSVSTPDTINSVSFNGGHGSSRVLLVDTLSASRSLLASQLERCGLEVICASSAREAAWRFEQGLAQQEEGSPFALIFVELQAASKDGYAAVKEIRKLEKKIKPSEGFPSAVLIVAITNMNRWDLAGMDNSMDKGMNAGVDAIIPQSIRMQQLRASLRKLGVRSKYLDVPTTLPRALSGLWHNPLNLSR